MNGVVSETKSNQERDAQDWWEFGTIKAIEFGTSVYGEALLSKYASKSKIPKFETSKLRISQTLETNAEMKTLGKLKSKIESQGFRYDMPFDDQMQVFQHNGINYLVNGHHRLAVAQKLGINQINAVIINEGYLMSRYGVTPTQLTSISNKANSIGNKIRWYR